MTRRLPNETRAHTIFRITQQCLRETVTSMETFAAGVVELYEKRVALRARTIRFHTGGDAYRDMRANAQILRRYMDDEVSARLPVDLEESWVLALPEPYREDCISALAARYGRLAPVAPEASARGPVGDLGRLMREVGEYVEALAPALADGVLDEGDLELIPGIRKELRDVQRELAAMEARLDAIEAAAAVTVVPMRREAP